MTNGMAKDKDKVLLEIAKKHLGLETLEARNMDCLDFSDQSVWGIKEALSEAYEAGVMAGIEEVQ